MKLCFRPSEPFDVLILWSCHIDHVQLVASPPPPPLVRFVGWLLFSLRATDKIEREKWQGPVWSWECFESSRTFQLSPGCKNSSLYIVRSPTPINSIINSTILRLFSPKYTIPYIFYISGIIPYLFRTTLPLTFAAAGSWLHEVFILGFYCGRLELSRSSSGVGIRILTPKLVLLREHTYLLYSKQWFSERTATAVEATTATAFKQLLSSCYMY